MSTLSPISPARSARRPRGRRRGGGRRGPRALALLVLGGVAFGAGAVIGSAGGTDERDVARRFAAAWSRGDYARMHALLRPADRRRIALDRFARFYRSAAETSTLEGVAAAGQPVERGDGVADVPMRARTKSFGTLAGTLRLQMETAQDEPRIAWKRHHVFPGLRAGETLARETEMPPRAELQARDGTTLARGAERFVAGAPASEIVGTVGPIPEEKAREFAAKGYPPEAIVGLTGLERELEERLAGEPGGTLRAGGRTLARVEPEKARPVRSSIDPEIQDATSAALGGRFGGVAVLRPRTGEILALSGIAASAPQPPGSTFKIITLAAALDAKVAKRSDEFPVRTAAVLEGVELENANEESCGGTLAMSFAHSCNSVFGPMGAELGAKRLVAAAERFGFNEEPTLEVAGTPSIPPADEIGDDLAVGSTAIGQGRVLTTPLHLAGVASAIATGGMYTRPTLLRGATGRRTRATQAASARTVREYMRAVVRYGTGTAAAIPGVPVAGKTGTAELTTTQPDEDAPPPAPGEVVDEAADTDAWFVAFAPARRPRLTVAVLLVGQGAGGATAAPLARQVLGAAL